MPQDAAAFVSLFGELQGISNISEPKKLQAIPYTVSSANRMPKETENPFRQGPSYDLTLGADLKYGLASNMTLDMTINPDFGQVEADPSEFNLTAHETYFEEKRPFFIEGNNSFDYRIGIGDDGDMAGESLFYSRRIGRAPHHYPDVSDDGYVDQPKWTRILAAGKLTGKTSNGWSIGLLEAVTREERADVKDYGKRYSETIEPLTNYSVIRTQKDFRQGRTTLGAIATGVWRELANYHLNDLNKMAFTGGIDFQHRWRNDTYLIDFNLVGSYIRGREKAIQEAQLSSARYYQRPDASHLTYDPTRTSLSGFASRFNLFKIAGEHWRWGFGGVTRSPGFEANDLGYLQNADLTIGFIWIGYREFTPGKIFRNYAINANIWGVWDYDPVTLGKGGNINFFLRFLNYWRCFLGINRQTEGLSNGTLRGGPAIIVPGTINTWFGFFSDERKTLSIGFEGVFQRDDEGFTFWRAMPSLTVRPTGRLNLTLSAGYFPRIDDRQYVDEIQDSDGTHYVLGRIRRKTLMVTTRLDFAFTPNLSLQFYGMSYISAGKYSSLKEVTDPRAGSYADRFQAYDYGDNCDFNFKQFRSNLVVRWEYSPGSTVFLVWSQGRTGFVEDGSFALSRDLSRLFNTQSENVFLVKINRWLNI